MIGWLHEAADAGIPVVLNGAAGRTTRSAIRDACSQADLEAGRGAHQQHPQAREFRQHSVVSAVADGVIAGLGVDGVRARADLDRPQQVPTR